MNQEKTVNSKETLYTTQTESNIMKYRCFTDIKARITASLTEDCKRYYYEKGLDSTTHHVIEEIPDLLADQGLP